jgi:hypothetical protein
LSYQIGQFAILGDEIIAKNLTKSLNMAAKTLKTRENEKMKGCVDSKVTGIAAVNNL